MRYLRTSLFLLFSVAVSFCAFPQEKSDLGNPGLYVTLQTKAGALVYRLDFKRYPLLSLNFALSAQEWAHTGPSAGPSDKVAAHWDHPLKGSRFFRLIPNHSISGGLSQTGGIFSSSYTLPTTLSKHKDEVFRGALAMLPLTRQKTSGVFFTMFVASDPSLKGVYSVFGRAQGSKTLANMRKIKAGDVVLSAQVQAIGDDAQSFELTRSHYEALLKSHIKDARKLFFKKNPKLQSFLSGIKGKIFHTPSGLYYSITTAGKGERTVKLNETAYVDYSGYLLNGKKFDSSDDRGEPLKVRFKSGSMIPGFLEALSTMKVGEKRIVLIPPSLGYGAASPGSIPPNSWLVFKLHLRKIR